MPSPPQTRRSHLLGHRGGEVDRRAVGSDGFAVAALRAICLCAVAPVGAARVRQSRSRRQRHSRWCRGTRRSLVLTLGFALAIGWPGHVAAGRAASTDYTFVSFGNYYATSINAGGYVLLNRSRGGAMDSSQVWHDGISQTVIPDDPPSHGLNDDRVFDMSDSGLISGTDLSPDFYPQPSTWRTSAPSAGTVLPAAANRLDYAGWINSRGDVIGVGEVPVPTNSYASQSYLFLQGGAAVPIGNGFGQLSTESDHTWVCGLSETGEILAGIYRSATGVNGLYLLPSANATPAMSTKLDFAAGACNGDGLYPNAHPMSRNGTVVVGRLRRNPDGPETTIGTSDFAAASVNDSGAVAAASTAARAARSSPTACRHRWRRCCPAVGSRCSRRKSTTTGTSSATARRTTARCTGACSSTRHADAHGHGHRHEGQAGLRRDRDGDRDRHRRGRRGDQRRDGQRRRVRHEPRGRLL